MPVLYNPFKTYSIGDDDEDLKKAANESSSNVAVAESPTTPATAPNPLKAAMSDSSPSNVDSLGQSPVSLNTPQPKVDLAQAQMADQPSAGRVNTLRSKLEQETQPMSPLRRAGLIGSSMIPIVGPMIAAGLAKGNRDQIAATERELTGAETQQNTEFSHDAARRQMAEEQGMIGQRHMQDELQRQKEAQIALGTHTATTYDDSFVPSTSQYNPATQRFDIPVGAGKPPGPAFTIQRHPTTNAPIGISRRGGQVVYDPAQFTDEEKQAFGVDQDAFKKGQSWQEHMLDLRDQAAQSRAQLAADRAVQHTPQNAQVTAAYGDANTASSRAKLMHQLLPQAEAGDAQADLALLMNHIGMTVPRGMKISQEYVREAAKARGYGNGDQEVAWFQQIMSGNKLGPEQRQQMVGLADEMERNLWEKADRAAQLYGVPLPPGRSQAGPGANGNPITQGITSGNPQGGNSGDVVHHPPQEGDHRTNNIGQQVYYRGGKWGHS